MDPCAPVSGPLAGPPSPTIHLAPPPGQPVPGRRVHPTNDFFEFPRAALERSIADRFEEIALRSPDRLAVKTQRHVLSYDALNRAANQVAAAILARREEGAEVIAFVVEKDGPLLAVILGVLMAGKICLPLDPTFPVSRLHGILEDARPGLIVCSARYLPLARELARDRLSSLTFDDAVAACSGESVRLAVSPDAVATITYTSGSTGRPKGIFQSHRNFLHDIMIRTNVMRVGPADRVSSVMSPTVVSFFKDMFIALLNGATFLPFDVQEEGLARLGPWVLREDVTLFHTVPTVFRHVVPVLAGAEGGSGLRLVSLGGETVVPRDVELYQAHCPPQCLLVVRLSVTETGLVRHIFFDKASPVPEGTMPVGYPVPDKEILIVDEAGRTVGTNAVGEIVVRSRYLALGYWRQPERTRAAFLPDPEGSDARVYWTGDLGRLLPDGCLEHLGRKDFQAKVRGARIQLAEVEVALLRVGGIREAVAMVREDRPGDQRLVAYVVPSGQPAPTIATLRRSLARCLPDAMLPSAYVVLDALPLTPSGKVDRQALPAPSAARPDVETPFVAPRTPLEGELARIWAEVLGLDGVGVHDNFLDLGAHSLLAAQVIARVLTTFRVEVSLRSLFDAPTVAAMAEVIAANGAQQAHEARIAHLLADLEALPEAEAARLAAEATRAEHPPEPTA